MPEAFICDAVSTPFGYGGALSSVRADDLAAIPIALLLAGPPVEGATPFARCASAWARASRCSSSACSGLRCSCSSS
jgi:hypothetical protein